MMGKQLLIPVALSFAGLLSASNVAHAQRGHGGGAYHGGAYHGGAYHGGPYHGGYYHGGNYRPYYGYGVGVGIGIGVGAYAPYYPYWYDPYVPRVAYSSPPTTVVTPTPAVAANQEGTPNNAQIRVLVSDPQAIVLFDGTKTSQTGTDRLFHTPPLTPGAASSYRIRAIWQQNGKEMTQERVVPVAIGQASVVDFTQPPSEGVPPPAAK